MANTITKVKWQGRQYVVISNAQGDILSITHNGFRVRSASREHVVAAFRQTAEEPARSA